MKKRLKKTKWYKYPNIKQKKSFLQYGYRSRFDLYDLLEKTLEDTLGDFNFSSDFDIIKIK
jgi:hypothetical protein